MSNRRTFFFLVNYAQYTHYSRTIDGQYTHYNRTIPITSVKDNNDYLGLNITASITSLQVVGQQLTTNLDFLDSKYHQRTQRGDFREWYNLLFLHKQTPLRKRQ